MNTELLAKKRILQFIFCLDILFFFGDNTVGSLIFASKFCLA